jgi:hypothetical protein
MDHHLTLFLDMMVFKVSPVHLLMLSVLFSLSLSLLHLLRIFPFNMSFKMQLGLSMWPKTSFAFCGLC